MVFFREDLLAAAQEIRSLNHVNLRGLMTVAPYAADPESVRGVFRRLRELRDACQRDLGDRAELSELSMGMSQDYPVAIEEGATIVRIRHRPFWKTTGNTENYGGMMSAEIWSKVKTFVGLDGDLDEGYEEEETMANEPKKSTRNIVGLPSPNSQEMVVLEPRSFDDALGIIENLRSRRAVILNLNGLTAEQSQRLVDFVSGACHALDGNQERIGDAIFLFAPSNVKINALQSEQSWMPNANPAASTAATAPSKDLFWRVR